MIDRCTWWTIHGRRSRAEILQKDQTKHWVDLGNRDGKESSSTEQSVAQKSNLENYKRFLKLQWSLFEKNPDKNVLKSFYNFLSFFGDARMVGWKLQTPNMGEGRPFYWLFPVEISDVIQHVQRWRDTKVAKNVAKYNLTITSKIVIGIFRKGEFNRLNWELGDIQEEKG